MEALKITKEYYFSYMSVLLAKRKATILMVGIIHCIKDDLMSTTFYGHILTHQMPFLLFINSHYLMKIKLENKKLSFENISKHGQWTFSQARQ